MCSMSNPSKDNKTEKNKIKIKHSPTSPYVLPLPPSGLHPESQRLPRQLLLVPAPNGKLLLSHGAVCHLHGAS